MKQKAAAVAEVAAAREVALDDQRREAVDVGEAARGVRGGARRAPRGTTSVARRRARSVHGETGEEDDEGRSGVRREGCRDRSLTQRAGAAPGFESGADERE